MAATKLTTEHVFENFGGGNCLVALPLVVGSASKTFQHHLETRADVWDLIRLGSYTKRSMKPCCTNRTIKQIFQLTQLRTNLLELEHHVAFAN